MRSSSVALSLAVCSIFTGLACGRSAPEATPGPTVASHAAPSASASVAAPATGPKRTDSFPTSKGELGVTPIHHATMLLEVAGKAIYVDPVAKDASYVGLPKADIVLVTDIHPDHMDPDGLAMVKKDGTVVVGPPAVGEKMPLTVTLKNGEKKDFGDINVEAVPMYNLTRGPAAGKLFHDKGRGNGYVLAVGGKRVYIAGDTECTPEMRALTNIDVAFVCMNLPYTMPPHEAAECVTAFEPKVVFPYHFKGSNLDEFEKPVKSTGKIEVRIRSWY
jgi:L-ascorbate metabolism protein UlaG (beta-lactamase superfamily)